MVSLSDINNASHQILDYPAISLLKDAFVKAVYGESFIKAAQFIGQQASQNPVTIITDPQHGDMTRRAFKASKVFMDNLKQAGVTHVLTERPQSDQVIIDALYTGAINKQTFINFQTAREDTGIWKSTGIRPPDVVRAVEYEADMILNAKQAGIKVMGIDPKIGRTYVMKDGTIHLDGEESMIKKVIPDVLKRAAQSPYFNPDLSTGGVSTLMVLTRNELIKEWYSGHPAAVDFKQKSPKSYDPAGEHDRRMRADPLLSFNIIPILAQGGKVVIDYGIGHTLRNKNDLDGTLTQLGIKTKVIDLYGGRYYPGDGTDIYKRWNERDDLPAHERAKLGLEKPYSRDSILLEEKKIIPAAAP